MRAAFVFAHFSGAISATWRFGFGFSGDHSPRKQGGIRLGRLRLGKNGKQIQLIGFPIRILGPGKGPLLQALGHQPQARAIPVNDFEPCVPAIAEYKERPTLPILVELDCDHAKEPVKGGENFLPLGKRRAHTPKIILLENLPC